MEITAHILDDRHRQRRHFADLDEIARTDHEALDRVWTELAAFLEMEEDEVLPHFRAKAPPTGDDRRAEI